MYHQCFITVINDVFIFTVTISRAEIYDKFKETDFIPLDFTLVSQFTRARQEHFLMSLKRELQK